MFVSRRSFLYTKKICSTPSAKSQFIQQTYNSLLVVIGCFRGAIFPGLPDRISISFFPFYIGHHILSAVGKITQKRCRLCVRRFPSFPSPSWRCPGRTERPQVLAPWSPASLRLLSEMSRGFHSPEALANQEGYMIEREQFSITTTKTTSHVRGSCNTKAARHEHNRRGFFFSGGRTSSNT